MEGVEEVYEAREGVLYRLETFQLALRYSIYEQSNHSPTSTGVARWDLAKCNARGGEYACLIGRCRGTGLLQFRYPTSRTASFGTGGEKRTTPPGPPESGLHIANCKIRNAKSATAASTQ